MQRVSLVIDGVRSVVLPMLQNTSIATLYGDREITVIVRKRKPDSPKPLQIQRRGVIYEEVTTNGTK